MFGLNFSRLPKHRKFDYRPLYYDPDKEAMEQRVDMRRMEMGEIEASQESTEDRIRSAFARKRQVEYSSNPLKRFYSLRIVLIAGFLAFVFYKFLNNSLLESIFGM